MAKSNHIIKRGVDIAVSVILSILLLPVFIIIGAVVRISSMGPVLYWSNRVGQGGRIFRMPKFRTMKVGTPQVATHLMVDARSALTPVGAILRRTSLDEIPQLWNVLKGEMSLVGPRPALFNQADLIALREAAGVNDLLPGITGWAQVNGRDELEVPAKVRLDKEYLDRQSIFFDLLIVFHTVGKIFYDRNVSH